MSADAEASSIHQTSNICDVCRRMLYHYSGYEFHGTYDLRFRHQKSWQGLEQSSKENCAICTAILERINLDRDLERAAREVSAEAVAAAAKDNGGKDGPPFLRAGLSIVRRQKSERSRVPQLEETGQLRLTVKLGHGQRIGDFILGEPKSVAGGWDLEPYISSRTGSTAALGLAKKWMHDCIKGHEKCTGKPGNSKAVLPTRLIDVSGFPKGRVRLVVTRGAGKAYWLCKARSVLGVLRGEAGSGIRTRGRYLTLSHCWGKEPITSLRESNLGQFIWNGIPLQTLPNNFQDAVEITHQLGQKYIWIDSLCIIQNEKDETGHAAMPKTNSKTEKPSAHVVDWRKESGRMDEIYGGSLCNISATAAGEAKKGLFSPDSGRSFTGLVDVDLSGVPGHARKRSFSFSNTTTTASCRKGVKDTLRCQVQDHDFWDVYVNNAPVNRRAWVLQERMMAPRILHFCHGQIAWECCTHDATEFRPEGIDLFRLDSSNIIRPGRFKDLNPDHLDKPVTEEESDAVHRTWKGIIEAYSKTYLTNQEDKLVALSGLAKRFSLRVGWKYMAGLWESDNVLGQLLWYVNPAFKWGRAGARQGFYSYPGNRLKAQNAEVLHAPSWSWASVNVSGHGLIFNAARVKLSEPEVKFEGFEAEQEEGSDIFGVLKWPAKLRLKGTLKHVTLEKKVSEEQGTRFYWSASDPAKEMRGTVYMDCPEDDLEGPWFRGTVMCLPVGTVEENLCCLVLRKHGPDTYRRIGLIRTPIYDPGARRMLESKSEMEGKIVLV